MPDNKMPESAELGRDALPTPALIVERAALDRNIRAMADFARAAGLALRPHAKTHKSAEIARRQIAAGAVGVCCAKLGEAEALAAEGIANILITSPIVAGQAVVRLAALNRCTSGLTVVVDHPTAVTRIAEATGTTQLGVMIDIDPGIHRTGVTSPIAAVDLARSIAAHPALIYRGVQFYCGAQQHIADYAGRRAAIVQRTAYLQTVLDALAAAGFAAPLVTGGGTGSFAIDAGLGVLTELQAGSYVFMDREYGDCEFAEAAPRFEPALAIDTRVISANTPGLVTLDAGLKAMATEAGPAVVMAGADLASRFAFMGDEHGCLITAPGASDPPLDARITLQPPHCDPTVNLYDRYAVCDGEVVIGFWPVTARGRSA